MAQSLVIVESPAKAKTIEKFLGKGYKVLASYGHVRALPSKQGMVDVDHGFTPTYQVLPESVKHIDALQKEIAKSDSLILATDPDREGEAIAWHLLEALNIKPGSKLDIRRVVFHEITKPAIEKAMSQPRQIATDLVNAQQARSILDYLVGFTLSPFLWKKIRYGLSAGRVQSVALRLICEREKEIAAFNEQEYWSITAGLNEAGRSFKATLSAINGERLDKFAIANAEQAGAIEKDLAAASYRVAEVTKSEKKRNPAPPFTTSTLQQEASRKLGFSARKTMSTAQKLYEGVAIGSETIGLITYMRTDSVNLSEVATEEAKRVITAVFGKEYALEKPRAFKNRAKNAQEAHEAIRPTYIEKTPEAVKQYLSSDQYRLYQLIWTRTVASQMATAILDATTVEIDTEGTASPYRFRASGQVIRFPGFMKLYIEGTDDQEEQEGVLPPLNEGDTPACEGIEAKQHFTQPPPRYSEARLVKTLEEYGIGRPSTYASIMNTLVVRKYVRLDKRTFYPEDIGMVVNDLLTNHFAQYVDYDFTANLEETLDAISRGEAEWIPVLSDFWKPFIDLLKQKEKEVSKSDLTTEATDKTCPECQKQLVIKLGRSGKFLACSGFPDCRHTEPLSGDQQEEPEMSDEKCDKCGAPMLIKQGRFGKFYACSAYPGCKNIQPLVKPVSLDITCPECKEGELMEKKSRYGKIFYSCNRYPKCKYALWNKPLTQPCPMCSFPLTMEKTTKREGTVRLCPQESCDFKEILIAPEVKVAPAKKEAAKKPAVKKEKEKKAATPKSAAAKKTPGKKGAAKKDE